MAAMILVNCKYCHDSFYARTADAKRGWGKFCSKSCKAKYQEKHTHQYANYLPHNNFEDQDYPFGEDDF
ncbi:Uncharacterised protein [uncultured archaeon]|nr:Uncharacterised protein [uncultured archaeon]